MHGKVGHNRTEPRVYVAFDHEVRFLPLGATSFALLLRFAPARMLRNYAFRLRKFYDFFMLRSICDFYA